MPGPAPKDPKLRQRRNKKSTRATLARNVEPRKRAPSLPDRGNGQEWHKLTKAWWRDLWHSPMADEYLRADEHALFRLAVLIDMFWLDPTKELAGEIRLQQQAFGLTPLDRRRLEWSIEQVNAAQSRTHARREVQEKAEEQQQRDPRELLRQKPKDIDLDSGDIPVVG